MVRANEPALREPLVLTLSRIHRSRSVDQLRQVFLHDIPRLIPADAYGMYLFDDELNTQSVFAYRAKPRFLSEYEEQRALDPLLRHVLKRKKFTHSLAMYSESEWVRQPLYDFLSRWGLQFSIEAPLVANGSVVGTINFATSNKAYFSDETLSLARFLCEELDVCCGRLVELDTLRRQSVQARSIESLPGRAGQVMQLAAEGLPNHAIAHQLGISENTVRYHMKRIYRRLGVNNRAQLAGRVHQ
ncbi:MAG: LuxR C-terminal-related transcriptional regulator [Gammaproteobacteria bacterium]|nr:LuxR C-terminal-related transcriptional regulator [Gammaproteobacteria bacterium]